jgi:hypothetical protein
MRLVGSYDLERRPRRIAANLIWDATARGSEVDVLGPAVEAGVLSAEDAG